MNNSFQTSFIPKKPIDDDISERSPISPITLISVIILIVTILATAGLFFYKVYLTNHKKELSISLAKARDSFEKETIDELELFSKRTEISKQILSKHIVLSPLFAVIGEITIPTVQFTKFEHRTNEDGFLVKMDGVALDYKSVALQSEMFNSPRGRFFKNVVFSNLVRNTNVTSGNNYISFNVEFNVDPELLSFKNIDTLGIISNPQTISPTVNVLDQELSNNPQ